MGVTPVRSRREFQVGPSQAIHSDPRALDPLGQLADVDLILLGRVSLLRILLSVISVLSVVIRSSYLPKSSPRLSAPARTCGRGRLARFSLPQRLAVWWVALPWPILPVPAVLLALCRVVEKDAYGVPGTRAAPAPIPTPKPRCNQRLRGSREILIGSIAAQRRLDGLVKARRISANSSLKAPRGFFKWGRRLEHAGISCQTHSLFRSSARNKEQSLTPRVPISYSNP